jgi:signal peptidase
MKLPEVFKRDYMNTIIVILVVLLFVFVFWFGLSFVFRTEHPILAVASGSMEPVLYKGDLILVEGLQNPGDIYAAPKIADPPGDIIVYRGLTSLIVHRVVDKTIKNDGTYSFETWGDANGSPDPREVNESDVVGRYTGFKVPLLGYVALFFDPFERKVAFIALWIVALIILELVPLARKRFKRDESEADEASLYK